MDHVVIDPAEKFEEVFAESPAGPSDRPAVKAQCKLRKHAWQGKEQLTPLSAPKAGDGRRGAGRVRPFRTLPDPSFKHISDPFRS